MQYGPCLKGLVQYLQYYQLLPLRRLQELVRDLFDHTLSQGTLVNASAACFAGLAGAENGIKEGLAGAKLIHVDEDCTSRGSGTGCT